MSRLLSRRAASRNESDDEADASFWKQSSWVASAVFLAVILLGAGITYVTGGGGADAASGQPAARPGPLTSAGSGGQGPGKHGRPGGCRTDDSATGTPTAAPEDLEWEHISGLMVPTSPTAGPTRRDGPVWWCYSHTPMGAVMAAHSILTHMAGADWRTVVDQQLVAGPGRDAFAETRATIPQSEVTAREAGTYAGFFVPAYAEDAARVGMLLRTPGGSLVTTEVSMRWSGGDWKVEPDDDGSLYSSMTAMMSTGNSVMWGDT